MSKRVFNFRQGFLNYSTIVCLVLVLLEIVSLIFSISLGEDVDVFDLINTAIDIIFYVFVASYFYKAKSYSKGNAVYAMLVLVLSTFIIPFIFNVIIGLVNLGGLVAFLSSATTIVGIAYSVILIIESRKPSKGLLTALIVLGIIIGLFSIINIVNAILIFIGSIALELSIYGLISLIITFVVMVWEALLYLIFTFYPFYLKKA